MSHSKFRPGDIVVLPPLANNPGQTPGHALVLTETDEPGTFLFAALSDIPLATPAPSAMPLAPADLEFGTLSETVLRVDRVSTLDAHAFAQPVARLTQAKLREAFPDLPDKPDQRTVFLKLRELRNSW